MMAKLGELGDYTSGNPNCASDNQRITLETFLMSKQRLSHEGQITFGSYWKKSSQSLQAINDQILTHPQYGGEPHLRPAHGYYKSNSEWVSPLGQKNSETILCPIGSDQRSAEQTSNHGYTTMFYVNNDPCHKLTSCFLNKGPSGAISSMSEISLQQPLPKVSIQQGIPMDHTHFGPSFAVGNTQPSVSHQVCSGNCKNQTNMNNQSNVDYVNRVWVVPDKKIKQFFVTVSGDNTGLIAEKDQMVRQPYYQGACIPKKSYHGKHVPQKAVAVVTPLAQPCAKLSKNLFKLNGGGPESKSVQGKHNHQPYALHSLQANGSGSKFPCNDTGRVHVSQEMPSETVVASGFPEMADTANVAASELNIQSERLCLAPLGCVSSETMESAQPTRTEDQRSTDFLQQNNSTVANKSYERSETTTDMESTDEWSSIPVTEWSLQRLRTMVAHSEQMQKNNQKDIPFIDLASEIVKLYWNGDYQKLCDAARSGHYLNIMKEVSLHFGMENSVVLKEISKEKLDQTEEDFAILRSDPAPPNIVDKSSCFYLNGLLGTHRETNYLSSLRTFVSKPKTADCVVTQEEQKIIEGSENGQTNPDDTSSGAVVFSQVQRTQLPPEPLKNCTSVMGAKALINEPICRGSENKGTNKGGETLKQKESAIEGLIKQSSITSVNICRKASRAEAMELTEMESENKGKNFARVSLEQEQPLKDSINKPSTMTVRDCKDVKMNRPSAKLVEAQGKTKEINLEEKPRNEESFPLFLCKQSPAMDVKPEGLPAAVLTPPSDSRDDANCMDPFAFVKINILSPEKAKRFFSGEPTEKVENKEKDISAQPFTGNSDQCIVKLLDGISEHKEHVDTKIKPTDRNSHTTEQVNNYCCLSKWFKVLGYGNGELCLCEKKAELNPGIEASGEGVNEINGSINTIVKTCVTSPPLDHVSMDEPDLVDVVPNGEDVPQIANVISETLMDDSVAQNGSHYSTKKSDESRMDLKETNMFVPLMSTDNNINGFGEKSRETTNPESQRKGRIIHLALYGSSHLNQNQTATNSCIKRKVCGIRSSDEVHLPAETINIIIDSECSDFSNNRGQINEEHILNLCRNSKVPSVKFTDNRRLESAIAPESKIDGPETYSTEVGTLSAAFDMTRALLLCKEEVQTKGSKPRKTRFSSASANQLNNRDKRSKNKWHSTSWAKIKKHKLRESKSVRSSFEMPRTFNGATRKSSEGLLLNFKVLPESFRLTYDCTTMATDQSAYIKSGPKVKTPSQKKKVCGNTGAWCVSPGKKRHFNSAQTSDMPGLCSTFQEFKRRYEQIKQKR